MILKIGTVECTGGRGELVDQIGGVIT